MSETLTLSTPAAPLRAVVALNPQEMQAAQSTVIGWAKAKLAAAEADLDTADALHAQLVRTAMSPKHAKALLDKAAKRVRFYEKVSKLLELGYVIVPPFPGLQVFAVRTDRANPDAHYREGSSNWNRPEQQGRVLAAGVGRYVSPVAIREEVSRKTVPNHDPKTGTHEVVTFASTEFVDEIDLPMRAQKPTIISAVGKALEEKLFDALGMAPAFRAADPVVCGTLRTPKGGELTFFVAWWLDQDDL